jgi:hypothetical protein
VVRQKDTLLSTHIVRDNTTSIPLLEERIQKQNQQSETGCLGEEDAKYHTTSTDLNQPIVDIVVRQIEESLENDQTGYRFGDRPSRHNNGATRELKGIFPRTL